MIIGKWEVSRDSPGCQGVLKTGWTLQRLHSDVRNIAQCDLFATLEILQGVSGAYLERGRVTLFNWKFA